MEELAKTIWGIHSYDDNLFLKKNMLGLGWPEMGNLSEIEPTREGDYGLFVTLAAYTKNAKKYLDNTPIIRGIDGTALVELILKYYDQLSERYQKLIPLKMVYIPVPLEDEQ